jgi:methylated-DNA-[protein]-cysteine S-methyltransferase
MSSTLNYRLINTDWGVMVIVARGGKLVGTHLPEPSRERAMRAIAKRWPEAVPDDRLLPQFVAQLADYFAGRRPTFDVECDLSGVTTFQRRVLAACRRIPAGQVATYGELARRAGRPGAARAVGRAMATNPVPLVIPCHRVVAADGSLCGFSGTGGLTMKRRLLEHEKNRWQSDSCA